MEILFINSDRHGPLVLVSSIPLDFADFTGKEKSLRKSQRLLFLKRTNENSHQISTCQTCALRFPN